MHMLLFLMHLRVVALLLFASSLLSSLFFVVVLFLVVDGVGATASDAVDDVSHAIARAEVSPLLFVVADVEDGILLDL